MKEVTIASFEEYISHINANYEGGVFYRGLKDRNYDLIPSIGRYLNTFARRGQSKDDLFKKEAATIRIFRTDAVPYLEYHPANILEILTLAQHHGLPTRIMDWSLNPLVALYFATVTPFDGESIVYALKQNDNVIDSEQANKVDPFNLDKNLVYLPPHLTRRIAPQAAALTIQQDPTSVFSAPNLDSIIIAKSARDRCKWALFKFGIHAKALFPGLDGIGETLRWSHIEGFPQVEQNG